MRNETTSTLLRAGAIAGPLYVGVGALEVLLRPGFDLRRHALSLMSNGSYGWVQIVSFVLSGVLVIGGAVGLRRAWSGSRGGVAGPVLLALYGLGLIGAGIFRADPMDGFPPGTPAGPPAVISWHGPLHFMSGGIGFLGLIAGCIVLAYRFLRKGERSWAAYSALTGIVFLTSFVGIASGTKGAGVNLYFTAGVVLAWLWLTQLYLKVRALAE